MCICGREPGRSIYAAGRVSAGAKKCFDVRKYALTNGAIWRIHMNNFENADVQMCAFLGEKNQEFEIRKY